jgi:outer membrane lipoprotein-sorting protein
MRLPSPVFPILLSVILAGAAAPAAAAGTPAPDLAAVRAQLADVRVMEGRFTQARHLSELPQPLHSSGDFLFARGHGVHWHTRKPFEARFVLTPTAMALSGETRPATRIDLAAQPGLRLVSELFLAMFALDLDQLGQHFRVTPEPAQRGWALALEPRDAAMATIARGVRVRGAKYVEEVEMLDSRGDRTVIRLTVATASREPPSAAIVERFRPAPP